MQITLAYDANGAILAVADMTAAQTTPGWWDKSWLTLTLDDSTTPTATTVWDSRHISELWTVSNGSVVKSGKADDYQLTVAKQQQSVRIDKAYKMAVSFGFVSSADGTTRTYGWSDNDQRHLDLIQSAIDHQIETFPIEYADINGNEVSITDQTMLTQLDKDANTFAWTQTKKRRSLQKQIIAATTIDDVQAILWDAPIPANAPGVTTV